MTDLKTIRDSLANTLALVDALMGAAPVIPSVGPPPGSPLANATASESMGGTILSGYASSNPGPATQPVPDGVSQDEYLSGAFDFARPNSYRIFVGNVTKTLAVPANSHIMLHTGDATGNEADLMTVIVADAYGTIARFDRVPVRYQLLEFDARPGTYFISTLADKPLAVAIRFEVK